MSLFLTSATRNTQSCLACHAKKPETGLTFPDSDSSFVLSALLSHPALPDLSDVHGMIIFFRIPSFIFFRFIEVFRFDLVMVKLFAYQHLCGLFESRLTVYFCQMQTGLFDLVRDIFAGDFAR